MLKIGTKIELDGGQIGRIAGFATFASGDEMIAGYVIEIDRELRGFIGNGTIFVRMIVAHPDNVVIPKTKRGVAA